MADEVILTLLKVTASGGIEAMNEGVARMYAKTEMWEVSFCALLFFFESVGSSELLVQHQVLLQKQMPEASPLISEMEEELAHWRGCIAKVMETVALEAAVSVAREEMRWVEVEAAAAAKRKAEVGKQQGTSKSVLLELSDDNEPSMVSTMCFLFSSFFFWITLLTQGYV
jgi:hypothetical protein